MSDPAAERLQAVLDRLAGGESRAAVQAEIGGDAELRALLALADDLATHLPASPPPAFRARLQVELQDRMGDEPLRPTALGRPWTAWRAWRLVPRLTALMVAVVLALGSAVVASAHSVPGEPLYPVKRAVEQTRLAMALSPRERLPLRRSIADARLGEVQALIERGLVPGEALLDDLVAAQEAALDEARTGSSEELSAAEQEARTRADRLAALSGGLDAPGRAVLQAAADALRRMVGPPAAASAPAPPRRAPAVVRGRAVATLTVTPSATPDASPAVAPARARVGSRADTPVPTLVPTRPTGSRPHKPDAPPSGGATHVPPTDANTPVPTEAPPLPTLKTGTDRSATLTAEARPTVTLPPPTPYPTMRPTRPWPIWPPRRSGGERTATPAPTSPIGPGALPTPMPPPPPAP